MSHPEYSIVLVTPVWNDSVRLSRFGPELAAALRDSDLPIQWIVADDGSKPAEQSRIRTFVEDVRGIYPHVQAMLFQTRSCKGGAIYAAWDANLDADWLGFVDADGAIDAESTIRLIRHAVNQGLDTGCVGVRHDAADTPVNRTMGRKLAFWLFTFLVRFLTGVRFEDTQCGAKVIPGRGYRAIVNKLQERGFIFDVELLLALDRAGYQIDELRIPWCEISGGKVHPFRHAWPMLAALFRIRNRLQAGKF